MNVKIVTRIAFFGLFLVLATALIKVFYPIDVKTQSIMLVSGFTIMLLGSIWRVVLEMNEPDDND